MADLAKRSPVKEGWVTRSTPHTCIGEVTRSCPSCNAETQQDRFRIIFGGFGGASVPFLRNSTRGKFGTRSEWGLCRRCGSLLPLDQKAERVAQKNGIPDGFLKAPPM